MLTIILLMLLSVPGKGDPAIEERVDLIELNHYFDTKGRLVFEQVIFYERAPETGRFQVRAWCLVEDRECLNRRPIKNVETGLYQVDWFDTDHRVRRRLISGLYRESWTKDDPERLNKRVHDPRLRIDLIKLIPKVEACE